MNSSTWISRLISVEGTRTEVWWAQRVASAAPTGMVQTPATCSAVAGATTHTWRGRWNDATASLCGAVMSSAKSARQWLTDTPASEHELAGLNSGQELPWGTPYTLSLRWQVWELDTYLSRTPWIFPRAPLKINGAPKNIQGNLTALLTYCKCNIFSEGSRVADKIQTFQHPSVGWYTMRITQVITTITTEYQTFTAHIYTL